MWKGAGPQGGATQIRNKARGLIEAQVMDLLPTPRTSDTNGPGLHGGGGMDLRTAVTLMPTPRATDGTKGGPNQRGSSGDMMLPSAVVLLQTPTVGITLGGSRSRSGARSDEKLLPAQAEEMQTDWGPYAPAIHRWEHALGRPAPSPTEPSDAWLKMIARRKAGKDPRPVGMRGSIRPQPRLSPRFTEWMMGVPDGWITDTPGVSRNDQLKAAGNGVVVAQAAAALRDMLDAFEQKEAAA